MERPPYVTDDALDSIITLGLAEDVGFGNVIEDVTSAATVPDSVQARGVLTAKDSGVIAGVYVAERVFRHVSGTARCEWHILDGARARKGEQIGEIHADARALLKAERLALNILQRMSGIATATDEMVSRLATHSTTLLDTRKTVPGLRVLDKWAVVLGGGSNHRFGLFDMILIKENHIVSAGGLEAALDRARDLASHRARDLVEGNEPRKTKGGKMRIEIEVSTLEELVRVIEHGGADRVMLDNFVTVNERGEVDTSRLEEALAVERGSLETEASGNVTARTIGAISRTGVDFISCGSLTHSVKALDISMLIAIDP